MPLAPIPIIALLLAFCAPSGTAAETITIADDVAEPPTLDPFLEFSEKNHTLIQQMLEGLVRFDADGRVEPALAESWEQVDPKRLRFKLRPGVRFHDGTPLTAEDVRFSVERFIDPAAGFPGRSFISSLDHVEVVGPGTVDLVTRAPDGVLIRRLAGLVTVVPERYYKQAGSQGFSRHPIGTGPFRFEGWEKGRSVVLTANPDYWRAGVPRFSRLVFRFMPTERQLESLLAGEIDIITDMPGTWTPAVAASGVARVIKKESFYTFTGSMRTDEGPLADVRVRRAINHAVDRTELIRYDAMGNGRPLATVTMRGQTGHDPSLKPYTHDLKKASALLREAGLEKGFKLKVFVKAQAERPFKIIRKQLKALRIDLQGTVVSDGEMLEVLQREKWDMTFGACPDPMAHSFFIQAIVFASGSPFSLMRSKEYDGRLAAMVGEIDTSAQDRLGRELDRYIYDNALGLFTYQRVRTYGVRKGVAFTPWITGMPFLDDADKTAEHAGGPSTAEARP